MTDLHWSTAITQVKPNEVRLRGYRIDELMGHITFAQAVYLALMGELPSPEVGRLIDAILVSSIDHGATPPSALAARTVASTGAPINVAVAAGVMSINKYHGGAIEGCMRVIREALSLADEEELSIEEAASEMVSRYRREKKRMPGFGHRIHTADPRTARLFELTREAGVAGKGVEMLQALESALAESLGRQLPINVDGAIAGVLVDLGIPEELANAFFFMARVPGLVAHVYEEQSRQRPMRRIHPTDHDYDGPPPRNLE